MVVSQLEQMGADLSDCATDSPGQNTGVGRLSLLQQIFLTQEQNPGLPHCRRILYQLNHQGSREVSLIGCSPLTFRKSQYSFQEDHYCFQNPILGVTELCLPREGLGD